METARAAHRFSVRDGGKRQTESRIPLNNKNVEETVTYPNPHLNQLGKTQTDEFCPRTDGFLNPRLIPDLGT